MAFVPEVRLISKAGMQEVMPDEAPRTPETRTEVGRKINGRFD
jgi:hypothetical protein